MPVELRCPECRAKLRLKDAPEEGTEVECPKCGHAFPTPETEAKPAAEKKPAATATGTNAVKLKAAPRKRKAIKHKSNPKVMIGIIIGGLALLAVIVSVLIWYMGRRSVPVEMLWYMPDDMNSAYGANVGHVQKYPEVFKILEPTYANREFKKAADAVGAACGTEGREWLSYAITGQSKGGVTTIAMRSKKEFDQSALSKLPG
ncbi:MAG TPA: zinc-ribbon domain-containing protein, partial [Gemmataceae bacterium]|nr:zinc-ribbon domain-containing protein [Gemmataceae bacterium]